MYGNNNVKNIILIGVVCVVLLFFVGFGMSFYNNYMKTKKMIDQQIENTQDLIKDDQVSETISDEEKTESLTYHEEEVERSVDSIKNVLMQIYDVSMIPVEKRNRNNILGDVSTRFEFAYYLSLWNLPKEKVTDYQHEDFNFELAGSDYNVAVEYEAFKEYYKLLYGIEFIDSMIENGFELKEGYLYGSVVTGYSEYPTLEMSSYTRTGKTYYFKMKAETPAGVKYTIQIEFSESTTGYIVNSLSAY